MSVTQRVDFMDKHYLSITAAELEPKTILTVRSVFATWSIRQ